MSGTVVPCFSPSARNCAASSHIKSPLKRYVVRGPCASEDNEQHHRVLGWLAKRFGLFDQRGRSRSMEFLGLASGSSRQFQKTPFSHAGSAVMAGVVDMNPTDPIEGMLISQLVVAHEAALSLYRRAWAPATPIVISRHIQNLPNGGFTYRATRSASRSRAATNHGKACDRECRSSSGRLPNC